MLNGAFSQGKSNSLMGEYASLLGDAVLRRRAREAEQTARIEAELAGKVKSEFISNMSHELRTPLNTVIGFSNILSGHEQRRLSDDEIIEYANLIKDAAGHLLTVINDILDISKIQSGRYTLDATEVALSEIIREPLADLKPEAAAASLTMNVRVADDLPMIRGDIEKLRQVFHNLISNAIKFTLPEGSIAIDGVRLSDGGVAVLIRDTGIGMTDDELAVALTPFGQVDGSRSRWREGTGLGLPIAKSLVELHGGRLEIKSEKNRGTEVAVLFPSRHQVTIAQGREHLSQG